MNLLLAIKRNYRYFVPSFIANPRRTVRAVFSPMLCFVMGISVGAQLYADRTQKAHISSLTAIATMALLLLFWWASHEPPKDSATRDFLRRRTVVAKLSLLLGVCYLVSVAFTVALHDRGNLQPTFNSLKIGVTLITIGFILPSPARKAG